MVHGKTQAEAVRSVENKWQRGTRPVFIKRQKTKPLNPSGGPVLHRQKEITNLRNRINDLRQKPKQVDFSHDRVPSASPNAMTEVTDTEEQTREESEAEHIKNWTLIEAMATQTLGTTIVLTIAPESVYVPTWASSRR